MHKALLKTINFLLVFFLEIIYLGGVGSSTVSSSTTALSLSPRLSRRSSASQGGESRAPVLLSANRHCNCRMTLCCLRIIASRCARLASISFCFLHSLDSNSNSWDDRVRSCSAFSLVSLATRSSCQRKIEDKLFYFTTFTLSYDQFCE